MESYSITHFGTIKLKVSILGLSKRRQDVTEGAPEVGRAIYQDYISGIYSPWSVTTLVWTGHHEFQGKKKGQPVCTHGD